MTDITDNEKRVLREWANENQLRDEETHLAARYILATVDAPAPTLAEELRQVAEEYNADGYPEPEQGFRALADRAAQMEHDLEEARAKVDKMEAAREIHERMYGEARAEVEQAKDRAAEWQSIAQRDYAKVELFTAERDEAHAEVAEWKRRTDHARAEVERLTADVTDITEVNQEIRRERDEARYTLAEVMNARDSLREDYNHSRDEVERLTTDLKVALDKVDRLAADNENLRRTDNYREFRERFLTVKKGAESNAETIDPADVPLPMPPGNIPGTALPINVMTVAPDPTTPSPDDVKPGEAWIVEVNGKRGTAMKDGDSLMPWGVVTDGTFSSRDAGEITLVSRLVPAPRVVTDADEL